MEDKTIDARLDIDTPEKNHGKQYFEPSEITGRSTEFSNAPPAQKYSNAFDTDSATHSPTVEEILASSFTSDVRQMAVRLSEMKLQTGGRRTADMSLSSESESRSEYDWGAGVKQSFSKSLSRNLPVEHFNSSKV